MSGHSHAANVAKKKEKNAAIKGKIYTKIGRELAVAAKAGAEKSVRRFQRRKIYFCE